MSSNPLLKKLGLADTVRAVIIHADDIGLCHAAVQAYADLWVFGTISSGAVMTPCAWFPATAELCRQNPGMDMGVHATLNCEWDAYRWGPVSTRDPQTGLIDASGYFHQRSTAVYEQAQPAAVAAEVNAQVAQALAAGIDVTHIDSHMGTIMHPRFVQAYVNTGQDHGLPNMLPRASARGFEMMGVNAQAQGDYAPILEKFEAQGLPMIDGLFAMPLDNASTEQNIAIARDLLGNLPVGLTHFILHPAIDTPELRAICSDWGARVANYKAFMSSALKDFIRDSGIRVLGYRAIREALNS